MSKVRPNFWEIHSPSLTPISCGLFMTPQQSLCTIRHLSCFGRDDSPSSAATTGEATCNNWTVQCINQYIHSEDTGSYSFRPQRGLEFCPTCEVRCRLYLRQLDQGFE
jgi:hypothetical protein